MVNVKVAFIILNVIRTLNIVSILAAMLAAGAFLVKTSELTTKIGWFNVFGLAEKVLTILFATFILVSELPWLFRGWYGRNWPLLGHSSGFAILSICLLFLGCDVLSYLTMEDTGKKQLGGDFYRMGQAAGCMCIIMAVINLPAGLFLQDKRRGLTARQVRSSKTGFSQREGV